MSERAGSTAVEVKGSHAVYESQPQAVAALIENAARESAKKNRSAVGYPPSTADTIGYTFGRRVDMAVVLAPVDEFSRGSNLFLDSVGT